MKTMQDFESQTDLHEIVLIQLNKILTHPLFLSSGILAKFLNFIVTETLEGKQDQIKEYTIALRVLNKPAAFDPTLNGIVRVHAKRLRDALSAYYDQKDFRYDCMISIPKGRYIPLFERMDNSEPSKKAGISSLYRIRDLQKNRIAFLPFKTYDGNISRTSFVDSLGEELTRQFAGCSELSVLSYYTTRILSPEKSEIKNLVSAYQVQYLISGSIRFEHSKIKVFVELIDAGSESQIWSGVYYQTAGAADYFRAVDHIASEMISDLSKIKSLECDEKEQIMDISNDLKPGKTDILYLDRYRKNSNPVRLLAGN
jgi:TolB-like protein